jgi:hypothetical protein
MINNPDHDRPPIEDDRQGRVSRLLAEDRSRSPARYLVSIGLMLLIVLGTVFGALYWRLGRGPMAAPFLAERARQEIGAKLPPGYAVDLADIALQRRDGALALILQDLTLRDATGHAIAAAPQIAVGVEAGALLTGTIEVRSIIVEGASGAVTIEPDGRVSLRPEQGRARRGPNGQEDVSIAAMIAALDALLEAAGSINVVELRDAGLSVDNKAFGRRSTFRGIDLLVRRTTAPGGLALSLAAGQGTINATIESRKEGARLIDVQGRGISVSDVLSGLAPGAGPPEMDATLDILGRARVDESGTVEQATFELQSAGGVWKASPDAHPFRFENAALALRWDPQVGSVIVERAMLRAGEGTGNFAGRMVPPQPGGQEWLIELDAPAVTIAAVDPQEPPLKLDSASIRARYDPSTRRLGIDKGEFSGPSAHLVMAGSVTFEGRTPGIGLGIAADRMSVVALKRFWPFFAEPKVRDWFQENVTGGMFEGGTLSLAIPMDALIRGPDGKIPHLPDSAVSGRFSVSDTSVTLLDTLPQLVKGSAEAVFTARHFKLDVEAAEADLGKAGKLSLTQGTYEIADLVPTPALQHVEFRLTGPSAALAKLMSLDPLSKASDGVVVDPSKVAGTADLRVELDLPLMPKPRDEDIRYSISGALDDTTIDGFEGQRLEKGDLKIAIEPGVLLLTGKALFAGLPATIDYRKAAKAPPQIAIGLMLDDAARKKRGIDFGEALKGPVRADIRVQKTDDGPRFAVDLDLTGARIRDLLPGWQKAPGRPGRATFVWQQGNEGNRVEDLVLQSGPIEIRGDINLSGEGKLKRAMLASIRFAEGDEAHGTIEPLGQGWKVLIKGRSLDLRGVLAALQRQGSGKGGDLSADIELDRATGFGDETLTGLDLRLETRGSAIKRLVMRGRFGESSLAVSQRDGGVGSEIQVQTSDAGSLLRFLDYYTHVHGGVLQAALTPRLDAMAGEVFMQDFQVRDEPALGQYRSNIRSSREGSNSNMVVAPRDRNSAQFSKLRLSFSRTSDRLTIGEGVVWGPDVGANISGSIDYAADKVNLVGTFVPAYAVNNLFSQIPIFGRILGGGKNEGLFAINFKVTGRVASPTLTVNPLSAIAPGFLRKLFEFQKE